MTNQTKNLIGYLLLGPFYACARNNIKNGLMWAALLIFNTVISVKFNSMLYSLMYLGAIIFASWYLNKVEIENKTIDNKTPWLHVIGWIFVYLFASAVITSIIM